MALFPELEEGGKGTRRILEIAIELNGRVSFSQAIASQDRIVKTKVACEPDDLYARIDASNFGKISGVRSVL